MSLLLKSLSKRNFCIRYSPTHEWVKKISGNKVRMGISDHAQHELGEVVYVDLSLKEIGDVVAKEDEVCNVESVKASSPVYTPVSGKILTKNEKALEGLNETPEDKGWLFEIEMTNEAEFNKLLSKEDYNKSI